MHLVTDPRPPVQRDRLIKLPEVERLTSLKKTTVYRLQREGAFPRCVQVTPRAVAWKEREVLEWMASRSTAADAATPQTAAQGAL